MSNVKSAPPKKPLVRLQRTGDMLRITYAKRDWSTAGFLVFWLCGWTIGCVVLAGVVIANFHWMMLLFALPFWAAEIFVAGLVGSMVAAYEEFQLDFEGATYRRTVWGITIARRRTPLSEITGLSTRYHEVYVNDDGERTKSTSQSQQVIDMHTVGHTLTFCGGIATDEGHWLAELLNEQLDSLKRIYAPISRSSDEDRAAESLKPEDLPAVLELRPPSTTQVTAPSDTTWKYHYDIDAITFTQRGRITLVGLGGVLFVCVFWNSIVGVFIAVLCGAMPGEANGGMPKGWEWWGLFFFLIPFELIGLAILVALLAALLEPVRRSRWILARNAVKYRLTWLGIGRTWTYEVRELERLELRKDDGTKDDDEESSQSNETSKKSKSQWKSKLRKHKTSRQEHDLSGQEKPSLSFTLALVDCHQGDVCKIEALSLGEACWIADVILRERSGWFV